MSRDDTYLYGHDPYGAMYDCQQCGWRFRTVERLRRHQEDDQDLCRETAEMRAQQHRTPKESPA